MTDTQDQWDQFDQLDQLVLTDIQVCQERRDTEDQQGQLDLMDTQVQWGQEDMIESQVLMEYQDTMELRERGDIWVSANTEMIYQNT